MCHHCLSVLKSSPPCSGLATAGAQWVEDCSVSIKAYQHLKEGKKVRIRCISHLNDCCIGHTKVRTETLTESTVIVGQKRQRKGGRCHCCSKIAWKYTFILCSLEMWGLLNNFSWLNISPKPQISQILSLTIVDLLSSPGTGREWQRAQWARQLWRGLRCTS